MLLGWEGETLLRLVIPRIEINHVVRARVRDFLDHTAGSWRP